MSDASARRFLAAWLPWLPSERLRASQPTLPDAPLALTHQQAGSTRLAALDVRAAAAGLVVGMTLADARAQLPQLIVAAADAAGDAACLEGLADACQRYTPLVAVAPPGALLLDITGAAHLCGGEAALAADLVARLARGGLSARLALAPGPAAALALAVLAPGPEKGLVAQAEDAAPVRALPAAALTLAQAAPPGLGLAAPDATAMALRRAGLATVGDVARQPRRALTARLGAALMARLDVLLGAAAWPLEPRWLAPAIVFDSRFVQPILTVPAALRVIETLVVRACAKLAETGQGGRAFEVQLFRADGAVYVERVETAAALRAPAPIMRLFAERLAALSDPLDPGFGYDLLRLGVPVVAPLGNSQLQLEGGELAEGELTQLVDRLSVRLGANRVRRLAGADSHIPEQAGFDLPFAAAGGAQWLESGPLERPIELFDPPQPVEVLAEVPDGPPRRFLWRRQTHDIVCAEGPERIAAEWWRKPSAGGGAGGLTRDYYRVEDSEGGRFWVFRHGLYGERRTPVWFVHGRFA